MIHESGAISMFYIARCLGLLELSLEWHGKAGFDSVINRQW